MDDIVFMRRAIELAKNGLGWVSPNPPVGCVIVDDAGKIVAEGYHEIFGEAHAEANALRQAGVRAKNATAYVTLMPCNHHGKTPPCTQALINAGIKRVVVSLDDPDPVSGNGLETLKNSGIEVETGLLAAQMLKLMHGFVKYIRIGLPHVTLKYAMTLDGAIATMSGDSKWISSEGSREIVQKLRTQSDAVMVGSNTVVVDNPRLNVRDHTLAQPFRVIVDSHLITPVDSKIFSTSGGKVIILGGQEVGEDRVVALRRAGAEVLLVPEKSGHLDLSMALTELSEVFGVRSILCEGGAGLAGALFKRGLIDRVIAFIAPKILGGCGVSPMRAEAPDLMSDAITLEEVCTEIVGGDILCEGWMSGSLEILS